MSSLREAFEEFDELDDILYDIDNKEDIEKLKNVLDSDEEDDLDNIEKIVDINAEDEEELQDSYVGQLLLYCPSCHTIHYAKKEDIIEDEENPEVVNVGEQCPHCDATEGFEIVGEVAPYNDVEETEDDENDTENENEDEFDLTDEDDLEDEKNFEENLKSGKQKSFLERLLDDDMSPSNIDKDGRPLEIEGDDDTIEEKVGSVLPRVKKQVKENKTTKATKKSLKESKLVEKPVYGLNPKYDSRKSFYGKAQVDTGDKGDQNKLYSYDTLVAEIKDGKPVVYGTYSQTTLRHIKDWLKQNGFKAENSKQIMNDYGVKEESCKENLKEEVQDEAYEIADYIYDHIKDRDTITRDEYEEQFALACRELYGIDNVWEIEQDGNIEINGKTFDANDLIEGDVRGILSYKGYSTVYEGENEGGLTRLEENLKENVKEALSPKDKDLADRLVANGTCDTKKQAREFVARMSKEDKEQMLNVEKEKARYNFLNDSLNKNLKESKSLKESAQDVYADILDRAKMNIDADYDVDEAIWDAIDNGLIYTSDEFEIIKSLFSTSDLYTKDGEPISTFIMEQIYNEIYGEVQDYFDEKNGEVDESLKECKTLKEDALDFPYWLVSKRHYDIHKDDDDFNIEDWVAFGSDSVEELKQFSKNNPQNEYVVYDKSKGEFINENLKPQRRTVDQIKESIKSKLDKCLKEAKDKKCNKGKCKTKKLKEDIDEYDSDFEVCCEDISNALSNGWWHGMTRSERSWGLVVDGGDGNQFSPIFADAIAYECSYPVSDGNLSLDGLDCILSKSSFSSIDWEDEKDLETFRTDFKNVGCDDDEITKFFNDEIDEIEFYIDFYIDIDDLDDDAQEDEIDESLFDNLINKYCTRVYENVKDYKTTNGYTQDHKLVLEGLLTYKSGKTTNTKFIFEKKMTKDNKVKYVGLNETFSKSKRAFSLNCNVENNKILSESLTYNYKVKVNDDRKVVYGSIKNN